jgi:lipopolysaccharide transport system ATP-binding protein
MTTSDNAIEIVNVSKHYKFYNKASAHIGEKLGFKKTANFKVFKALDNINLTLGKGERIGLVGRNGAGKTTLLKLIVGHIKPTSGSIKVNGAVQAMMKSDMGFHVQFTGRQNAIAALAYNGIYGDDTKPYIDDIEDFTELGPYFDQPFASYSLGMQSRLLFAVSSAVKPDILIVDEMLGAGDAYFMSKSAKRMQNLIDSGCSLLLVSHNTQQVLQFCEKAIWMRNGQIYDEGSVRDVVNSYDVYIERQTELRHTGIEATDQTDKREVVGRANHDEYKVPLDNGMMVYRWPSAKGIKLSSIELLSDNKHADTLYADKNSKLNLTFNIEETRDFETRYLVTIWDLKGKRIARIENDIDKFFGTAGEKRNFSIDLNPLQLNSGDYSISISSYDFHNNTGIASIGATRMDQVSNCIKFKVHNNTNYLGSKVKINSNWEI